MTATASPTTRIRDRWRKSCGQTAGTDVMTALVQPRCIGRLPAISSLREAPHIGDGLDRRTSVVDSGISSSQLDI